MIMKDTLKAFSIHAENATWQEFGSGRINNTYMVTVAGDKDYVLQKINKYVFEEPEKVMANISAVTNYLHAHGKGNCTTLRFLTTADGLYYHIDEDGEYWRRQTMICTKAPWPLAGFRINWQIFPQKPFMRPFPTSTTPSTAMNS